VITVQNAIRAALRKSNVVAQGQIPSGDELNDSTEELVRMLDSWDADHLNCFMTRLDTYSLVSQQQSYTIGIDPSGILTANFHAPRPTKIVNANVIFLTSPPIRKPLALLDNEDWSRKRLQQVYTIPAELYNDLQEPLSTLYFYPIPDSAYQIELYTWQQLTNYANLTDNIIVPPGYEDAIVTNLAVRLALEFGKRPTPELVTMASQAKALIQSKNSSPPPRLHTEPGINGRHSQHGRGNYNRFTGLMDA
jgi:hypothetical protein